MEPVVLNGLSDRQKRICDCLWQINNTRDLELFVENVGAEARAMRDLMVAEVLDQHQDIDQEVVDILNGFRL